MEDAKGFSAPANGRMVAMTVIDMKPYRERQIAKRQFNPVQLSFDLLVLQFKAIALCMTLSVIAIDIVTENIQRLKKPMLEP